MTGTRPLRFHPLAPDRWDDLVRLFGDRGACGGCWCMYWRRRRPEYEAGKGAGNRSALRRLVDTREPLGILAYDGAEPVGWCACAPRSRLVRLAGSRILKPVDDSPVWSITCLFVARPHRRRGVSTGLLQAAAAEAGSRGARVVEGYPVEPRGSSMPPVFAFTGIASAFRAAGFTEVARRAASRPIMRLVCAR